MARNIERRTMVRIIGILIVCFCVTSCAFLFGVPSNHSVPRIGNKSDGPFGWYFYCQREENKQDVDCQKRKDR